MLKVAVIGASGFTGVELVKLLKKHPMQEKIDLYSFGNAGKKIKDFSDQLIDCEDILKDFSKIVYDNYDLVFFACPNGTAMNAYSDINKSNVRIIDLAADYRLDDNKIWEKYYKIKHKSPEILAKTIYGLTEINRKKIVILTILAIQFRLLSTCSLRNTLNICQGSRSRIYSTITLETNGKIC